MYMYMIAPCSPPPPNLPPNGIHHLVLPAPLLWDGLGIELARGMVWLFGLGLLAMVVHVIIPHPPWERLGSRARSLQIILSLRTQHGL